MLVQEGKNISLISLLLGLLLLVTTVHAEDWIYTVKKGDTIWDLTYDKLIVRHAWSAMLKKNGITAPKKLKPGTKVSFPLKLVKKNESSVIVANVFGDVNLFVNQSTQHISLKPAMILSAGDRVTTGDTSTVLLLLADESSVIIQSNSDVTLSKIQVLRSI